MKEILDSKNMDFAEKMSRILSLRAKIYPENDWQTEDCWEKLSDFYVEYLEAANDWLRNVC